MTLFVNYDGWYEDYQGTPQRLSKEVLRVVQTMKVGQKVLIVEEKTGIRKTRKKTKCTVTSASQQLIQGPLCSLRY
jgi:hypothetical protein